VSRRQVRGWDRLRRVTARFARAVCTARWAIAGTGVALAAAGLAVYIAAGSGLIGAAARAAPAAVAPAATPHPQGTPKVARPGGASVAKPPAPGRTPSAAGTMTAPPGGSAVPGESSGAARGGNEHERNPKCPKGCRPHKPRRRPTSTSLVASPSPATVGDKVRLTATERTSGGGHVAGHVQFQVGQADIGTPVAVNAKGVAIVTTTFAAPGKASLSAEFTPTSAAYRGSKGKFSLVVRPVPANVAGVETISVTVPRTGEFVVTIGPDPIRLTPSGSTAAGKLPDVTVTDTRNYKPGWSLSGQASRFTYSRTGKSVAGNQLGWMPTVVGSLTGGAQLGRAVAPARPGLGSAPATLAFASAGCGFGTNVVSANLTLAIPRAVGGRYSGTVTITYVESDPASADDDQAACGKSSKPAGGDR
jgi:hypothetical protein